MSNEPKIVMYESSEAAAHTTVSGWLSRDGSFWPDSHGEAEHMARYCGSTHQTCECGNVFERGHTCCEACRNKHERERFMKLPAISWREASNVYLMLYGTDEYLHDADALLDYCRDNLINPRTLMVAVAAPNKVSNIDVDDHLQDDLAEDCEPPDSLIKAFDELNKAIDAFNTKDTISWGPTCSHRIEFTEDELADIERNMGLIEEPAA